MNDCTNPECPYRNTHDAWQVALERIANIDYSLASDRVQVQDAIQIAQEALAHATGATP